jgi:hypothetical protein
MTSAEELQKALAELTTERIQRLVDRLERDPEANVTVGAWRPRCPMVLAGFDPATASPDAPETRFAAVWDRVAVVRRGRWWNLPVGLVPGRAACRADVRLLWRMANGVLAHRAALVPDVQREMTRIETRSSSTPGRRPAGEEVRRDEA